MTTASTQAALILAGIVNSHASSMTNAQTSTLLGNINTALATIQADNTLPSTTPARVTATVNAVSAALNDIAINANSLQIANDMTAVYREIEGLSSLILAATLVEDINTNGCTGYSAVNASNFQTTFGLPVTGVYDAATVQALPTLLAGTGATIPAVCPASNGTQGGAGGGSGWIGPHPIVVPVSPGNGTTTSTPTTTATSSSTTAIVVGVVSIAAIGTFAYLLSRSQSIAAKAAKIRRR